MGRTAKGVRVMKVTAGAKVVAFTRAEHEENAETEKVEQITDEQALEQEDSVSDDEILENE